MKGFLWTAAALIVLEVLVTSTPASGIGGAFGAVTGWIQKWMDPSVPLISAQPGSSASTAAATTTTVPPASRLPAPSAPVVL